ncbi:MAG: DNA adenine methylase [Campylobacterales bacterium]
MTAKINNFTKAQPFVKWVGGKRGLLPDILKKLPKNFNNYFEPFVGGGALFFELFSQGKLKNKKAYLFDKNSELISAYEVVRDEPDALIELLQEFKQKHSKDFYYEVREKDRDKNFSSLDALYRAARFIYLNKTCFNGMYRVNKKGFYNVPIGSYKNPNICEREVLLNASYALQNAVIKSCSYDKVLSFAQKGDLVYFDPPYYPLSETSSFTSYNEFDFLEKEQIELYETFKKLATSGVSVLLSNSDSGFINDLYREFEINHIMANRFINSKSCGRGKIREILVTR